MSEGGIDPAAVKQKNYIPPPRPAPDTVVTKTKDDVTREADQEFQLQLDGYHSVPEQFKAVGGEQALTAVKTGSAKGSDNVIGALHLLDSAKIPRKLLTSEVESLRRGFVPSTFSPKEVESLQGLFKVNETTLHSAKSVQEGLNSLEIIGKDGQKYRLISTISEDGKTVSYTIHQVTPSGLSSPLGKGSRDITDIGYGKGSISIPEDFRKLGIGTQINKKFYEMAPEGGKIVIDNGNMASSAKFMELAEQAAKNDPVIDGLKVELAAAHKAGDKAKVRELTEKAGEHVKDKVLTLMAAEQSAKGRTGVVWYDVLKKSGWDNVDLIPSVAARRNGKGFLFNFNLIGTKAAKKGRKVASTGGPELWGALKTKRTTTSNKVQGFIDDYLQDVPAHKRGAVEDYLKNYDEETVMRILPDIEQYMYKGCK